MTTILKSILCKDGPHSLTYDRYRYHGRGNKGPTSRDFKSTVTIGERTTNVVCRQCANGQLEQQNKAIK